MSVSDWLDNLRALTAQVSNCRTVDAVLAACPTVTNVGEGWWPGDGDDLLGVLYDAGWRSEDYRAPYYWCVREPDGDGLLSYVEGDLDRGNVLLP